MRVGTKLGALGPGADVGKAVSLCLWQRSLPSPWQMSDSRGRFPVRLLLFPEALNKCCASLCPGELSAGVIALLLGVWEGHSCCFLVSYKLGNYVS